MIPIALQLYTVRDDLARDFAGTLRRVADVGYRAVELAGTGGYGATDLKDLLGDLGLAVAAAHVGIAEIEGDADAVLGYHAALGNTRVVVPFLPADRRTLDAYKQVGETLDKVGERFAAAGITLAYHNHAFEFEAVDANGESGFDTLFSAARPESLKVELDTFWAKKAGLEPAALMRRYAGRVPLVHLKDMTPDGDFAEVGTGTMDFPAIFAAADAAGTEYYVVEQDRCAAHPPLESIRISFENLKTWGMVS